MEASEEILLNSLANSGVPIPAAVVSVADLTPATLFSVSSHALRLIDAHVTSFPPSLPDDSTPERVKICTDLAEAFNHLGFNPSLSFHKFLYPSKEDLYKLVRFLVGKLSESSGSRTTVSNDRRVDEGDYVQNDVILDGLKDVRLENHAIESPSRREDEPNSGLHDVDIVVEDVRDFSSSECDRDDRHSYSSERVERSEKNVSQNQEEVLKKLMAAEYSELQHPDEELRLLKEAAEMVFDGQHPVEFYIEQLNDQVEAKRHKLRELESEWDTIEQPLRGKKRRLQQSTIEFHPETSEELKKVKEIELETESILAQIKRREEEISKLSSDLEKQPKLAPRRSYIERINEITKNSRKQDNGIQRILTDTRELQLESNTIQERLNRTCAIVDETIFREAKKDPVARQAYRLLTKIHGSFEQVSKKILAADRIRRDAAYLEAKLAIISGRGLNIGKLQADLDAIRKENDLLEQQLH